MWIRFCNRVVPPVSRIFDLESLTELLKIEAHDSEVLCLEFSPLSSGEIQAAAPRCHGDV